MTLEYVKHLISLCFGGSAQLVQVFVCNQKYFYLVSQVITIVAVFLEMLAPIFHQYAMYALCFKMFLNAMTNVISGSCRAPLIAHLARDNNFSDCRQGTQPIQRLETGSHWLRIQVPGFRPWWPPALIFLLRVPERLKILLPMESHVGPSTLDPKSWKDRDRTFLDGQRRHQENDLRSCLSARKRLGPKILSCWDGRLGFSFASWSRSFEWHG